MQITHIAVYINIIVIHIDSKINIFNYKLFLYLSVYNCFILNNKFSFKILHLNTSKEYYGY